MKLVVWTDNWADEMDVMSVSVFEEKEYQTIIAELEAAPKEFWEQEDYFGRSGEYGDGVSLGVGTNEGIGYRNYQAFRVTLRVSDISQEQTGLLEMWFGSYLAVGIGTCNALAQMYESLQEFLDPEEDE